MKSEKLEDLFLVTLLADSIIFEGPLTFSMNCSSVKKLFLTGLLCLKISEAFLLVWELTDLTGQDILERWMMTSNC